MRIPVANQREVTFWATFQETDGVRFFLALHRPPFMKKCIRKFVKRSANETRYDRSCIVNKMTKILQWNVTYLSDFLQTQVDKL